MHQRQHHFDPSRFNPASVPAIVIDSDERLEAFAQDLRTSVARAADTETYGFSKGFTGFMRVASFAFERPDGTLVSYVYDAATRSAGELAPILSGFEFDGWNATFDARVFDAAVFAGAPSGTAAPMAWFDGMIADAVLHAGRSGFTWFHALAWAARRYLGVEVTGKGTTQTSFTATDPLTAEQVRYAAADAVETLGVCAAIRNELAAQQLGHIAQLECDARPFLDKMERFGLPFDRPGWEMFLKSKEAELATALSTIAELTGGGQASLFSDAAQPTWNPRSDVQVKEALNNFSPEKVRAHLARTAGEARLLGVADRVDKDTLSEIGGDLCKAILKFRSHEKVLTTYGENLYKWLDDGGRMHPQYLQVVGTDTGRLSSRNPNAQNFSPMMKKFFRPASEDRVFVYADLSQAELRQLAHESGDEFMLAAFREGRDIHVATAERMFGVSMKELAKEDPKAHKTYRAKAKTLNFGIVYGLGATALARRLTLGGVPTTPEEGTALLEAYRAAYPKVAQWLSARDSVIDTLAGNTPAVDWEATRKLASLWAPATAARRVFRDANGRAPSAEELAERISASVEDVEWMGRFEGPVVLLTTGEEYGFESFTPAGRRRRFNVTFDQLTLSIVSIAARSKRPDRCALRREFAEVHGIDSLLSDRPRREEIVKAFEDRSLRLEFIDFIMSRVEPEVTTWLIQHALSDRITAMRNAYRNAPIQGGVSDIVLGAYARLDAVIDRYEDAWPVQTVHDSVTIECSLADAFALAADLKAAMEEAMAERCPSVPAVADADVRWSLDDSDVIEAEALAVA